MKPPLPPLSQSRHADMACDLLYVSKHIRRMRTESAAARRGSEIHRVIADYMDRLNITHQQTDYKFFEELSANTSDEAREVLQRFCESWFFDSEKIYDTEIYIALNEKFGLETAHGKSEGHKFNEETQPQKDVLYEGTIDLVVMESEQEATIYDWKSYYQIVNADSFQSKLYPLLLFMFNPGLEKIRFVLAFVRYGDVQRDVTYIRSDVPALQALARRERLRQMELHSRGLMTHGTFINGVEISAMPAAPGRHCMWCPLLVKGCPMALVNPFMTMKPEERVAFQIWSTAARKENIGILKDIVAENGPVIYRDQNGTGYEAGFALKEKRSLPASAAIPILQEWDRDHNESLLQSATLSGISSFLKAKKRVELATAIESLYTVKTESQFKVTAAEDEDEDR